MPQGLNFNTLMGAVTLAVVMWVGKATFNHGDSLTKIETQLPYVAASVTDLKAQMATLVTRGELESLRAEVSAKNAVLDKRLMQLEFERRKPEQP